MYLEAGVGHAARVKTGVFPHENSCACPGGFFWLFILWEVQFPKRG